MESRQQKDMAIAVQQQAALMKSFAAITHKCFLKCVPKPGKSLSITEETCATNCVDRYHDTQNFLITRFQQQAENERTKAGMQSE